jgi:hypothetical protein
MAFIAVTAYFVSPVIREYRLSQALVEVGNADV